MNNQFRRQRGLSMIELLVALALSSFLILGVTQVYIDNKRSYLFQQSQMLNLDSARFADLMLGDLLGKAGYQRAPRLEDWPTGNLLSSECSSFERAAVTRLKDDDDVGFCIRYQPAADGELTCAGTLAALDQNAFQPASSDELVYIAVKFVPDDTDLHNGTLQCIGHRETGKQIADLINGVADFRVEFGVYREDSEDIQSWEPAADWTSSAGPVHAIRYSMLLASAPNQRDGDSAVFERWINDPANDADRIEVLEAQDNRRIYQIATGSQALRNLSL